MNSGLNDYTFIILIAVIAVVAVILQTIIELRKRPKQVRTTTKTLLECIKCGYRLEQPYTTGDFVGLVKTKCPKCGSPMKVIAVYDVELKTRT